MLNKIEPLDPSVISKSVYGSAKDSIQQTISTMLGLLPSDHFSVMVDYTSTPEEVHQDFQSCGTVKRVTTLTHKFGQPMGFAYVEFVEVEAVEEALALNVSEVHGRQLKTKKDVTTVGDPFDNLTYNIPEKPMTFIEVMTIHFFFLI